MQDKDRLLRTFLLVADSGSLQRTADKLGLSQPAVSKQISALEDFMGCALFKRHGRGMTMTQVGLRLAENTAEQFALLDAAMDNARASADASRFVRIATVNTLAAYFVTPVLAELKRLHPALVVRVDNASSPEVVDQIVRGHADIGLVYDLAVNTDAVSVFRLYHESVSAYETMGESEASTLQPATGAVAEVSVADLARRPLILPPRPYALRRVVERELPGPLTIAAECNSVSVSLDLAGAGLGTAILPSALPDSAVVPRRLRRFRISDADLGRHVVAIHRSVGQPSKAMIATLQVVKEFAAREA
jgi:LysR family nitrogen assimilation transcriptional regulator